MISQVPAPRLRLHLVCKRAALLYQSQQLIESLWNEIKDKTGRKLPSADTLVTSKAVGVFRLCFFLLVFVTW